MAELTSSEQVQELVDTILVDINEKSGLLKGLKQLKRKRKLEEVNEYCKRSHEKCQRKWETYEHGCENYQYVKYELKYEQDLYDYLIQNLGGKINLKDITERQKELMYVLLYFLLNGKKPDKNVQNIIRVIWDPTEGIHPTWPEEMNDESWWEICCRMLIQEKLYYHETGFKVLYNHVGGNPIVLEHIIRKNTQLFTKSADVIMYKLMDHMPFVNFHQCLMDIRDEKGQTIAFHKGQDINFYKALDPNFDMRNFYQRYTRLYKGNSENRYQFLSIQDQDGKTALFGGNLMLIGTLLDTYNPNQRDSLIKLLSIKDNAGCTLNFTVSPLDVDELYLHLFRHHAEELYSLLSMKNNGGQTALTCRNWYIGLLLENTYTPRHRKELLKALATSDEEKTPDELFKEIQNNADHRPSIKEVAEHAYENRYMNLLASVQALIICNTKDRPNGEQEALSIKKAFTWINTTQMYNLNKEETLNRIQQAASGTMKTDSRPKPISFLIVVLMSHGSKGTIDDCDGEAISLAEVEEAMCDNWLADRPKLLIIQCCQSDETTNQYSGKDMSDKNLPYDPGEPSDSEEAYTPTHDHFCAIQSCVVGEKSTRGVFIPKLAEQIRKRNWDVPINKLFESVCKEMKDEGHAQTPIMQSTLKAELCLYLPVCRGKL